MARLEGKSGQILGLAEMFLYLLKVCKLLKNLLLFCKQCKKCISVTNRDVLENFAELGTLELCFEHVPTYFIRAYFSPLPHSVEIDVFLHCVHYTQRKISLKQIFLQSR